MALAPEDVTECHIVDLAEIFQLKFGHDFEAKVWFCEQFDAEVWSLEILLLEIRQGYFFFILIFSVVFSTQVLVPLRLWQCFIKDFL